VIITTIPPPTVQQPYDPGGGTIQAPIANPGGPYAASVGAPVPFDGSGSIDPDGGAIIAYDWAFGDGNTGTGENPVNIYTADGNFSVTLTVTDDMAQVSDPVSTTATINPVIVPDDNDNDGILNEQDNCIDKANGPLIPDAGGHIQRDTDADGLGNICDPDFNGNGIVDPTDFSILKGVLGQPPGPSCCAP